LSVPQISVAIPIYNSERTIASTLASVAVQSFSDFEIVAIDDGSTDNSADIVAGFDDPRVRLIRQDNAGPSAARNAALHHARAAFVAFLDSDDLWRPAHLQTLVALSRRFPEAGLLGDRYIEAADNSGIVELAAEENMPLDAGRLLDDYFAVWAREAAPFCTSTFMVRRQLGIEAGGYKSGYWRGEDLEFYVRMALVTPVAASNYIGGIYRRTATGLTSRRLASPDVCMETIDRLLKLGTVAGGRATSLREFYNKLAIAHALDCLLADDAVAARKFLDLSEGTVWHRRRWQLVRVLAALPGSIRQAVFALQRPGRRAR
jgi:glycosyltransferase involved in cell wall biosynthesis